MLGDFPSRDAAQASIPQFLDIHYASKEAQAFLSFCKDQGIPIPVLPHVLQAYRQLCDTAQRMLLDMANIEKYGGFHSYGPDTQTLGAWMDQEQHGVDICLIDGSGNKHLMDGVLYLHPEDRTDPAYQYTPQENWLRALPLSRIENLNDHAFAVINTSFTTDQLFFLLGDAQDGFDSLTVCNDYDRASYANADFSSRLAYLESGTPFERPFDGECMDVLDPTERSLLKSFLTTYPEAFIYQPYTLDPSVCMAYALVYDENDRVSFADCPATLLFTERGKGFSSTVDGKLFYAEKKTAAENSYDNTYER